MRTSKGNTMGGRKKKSFDVDKLAQAWLDYAEWVGENDKEYGEESYAEWDRLCCRGAIAALGYKYRFIYYNSKRRALEVLQHDLSIKRIEAINVKDGCYRRWNVEYFIDVYLNKQVDIATGQPCSASASALKKLRAITSSQLLHGAEEEAIARYDDEEES